MFKLGNIFLLISFVLTILGCGGKSGSLIIDLSGDNTFNIEPPDPYTTNCILEIKGFVDCKFDVAISALTTYHFEEGVIEFRKKVDWFDEEKTFKIMPENCSDTSKVVLKYKFRRSYF